MFNIHEHIKISNIRSGFAQILEESSYCQGSVQSKRIEVIDLRGWLPLHQRAAQFNDLVGCADARPTKTYSLC